MLHLVKASGLTGLQELGVTNDDYPGTPRLAGFSRTRDAVYLENGRNLAYHRILYRTSIGVR